MAFDVKTLAMINLTIQLVLFILLTYAAFLAKKRDLRKHWIYINLAYSKITKWPGNFRSIMRSAYFLWTLAFIIGLHIYIRFYL